MADVEVSLLFKITGPSNSETISALGPPSILMERSIATSEEDNLSKPTLAPEVVSSPVTVGMGTSSTSSSPVVPLIFLPPT